jgi:hypothetical protein
MSLKGLVYFLNLQPHDFVKTGMGLGISNGRPGYAKWFSSQT